MHTDYKSDVNIKLMYTN